MVRSLLLEGVSPQEYQTMRACLGVHEQSFRPDDVIYDFGDGRGLLGIVTEGSAVVERIDREGGPRHSGASGTGRRVRRNDDVQGGGRRQRGGPLRNALPGQFPAGRGRHAPL